MNTQADDIGERGYFLLFWIARYFSWFEYPRQKNWNWTVLENGIYGEAAAMSRHHIASYLTKVSHNIQPVDWFLAGYRCFLWLCLLYSYNCLST